jgi:hypothetical protein
MFQRLAIAAFGIAILLVITMDLLRLPKDLQGAERLKVKGVPSLVKTYSGGGGETFYVPKSSETDAFTTRCGKATAACDWVRSNPGVSIEAEIVQTSGLFSRSFLVTFSAMNGYALDPAAQERELASHKGHLMGALLGIAVITILLWCGHRMSSSQAQ